MVEAKWKTQDAKLQTVYLSTSLSVSLDCSLSFRLPVRLSARLARTHATKQTSQDCDTHAQLALDT